MNADLTEHADGRVQRGARSRARIVDALSDLVLEGHPRPTAEQVAERAGVGTRTVFRHFDDMESLHAEMHARISEIALPLITRPDPTGSVSRRVAAIVEQRATLFERIGPFKRSSVINRWSSPFLQRGHADFARQFRLNLVAWLPELERAPQWVLEAADVLVSFETWDRLRSDQRLGRDRAADAVREALVHLIEGQS